MKKIFRSLDTVVVIAVVIVLISLVGLLFWAFHGRQVTIDNGQPVDRSLLSPLTGKTCADATRRPIAVMLSSDPEARPLSGIGQADMVFEMPVTPNGITRMMAVFQCHTPAEIGSIRSARGDFIPLAQGLRVIFTHWGGERDALAALNSHVTDNVNCLLFDGTTCLRKKGIPSPHDGFTTLALVRSKAAELGYTASSSTPVMPHADAHPEKNLSAIVDVASVSWPQHMNVTFTYDSVTNTYARTRGGTPEIDKTTGQQVHVSVVIIIKTDSKFLYDQYIHVGTVGQGVATIYQDGRSITAQWHKPTPSDMLVLTDSQGKVIPLSPGPIWVDFDAPLPQP